MVEANLKLVGAEETNTKTITDLFGDILLKRGQIRRYQLDFALALQKAYRGIQKDIPIGELLVQHRAISDKTREDTVSVQKDFLNDSETGVTKVQIMDRVDLNDSTFVTKIIGPESQKA